MPLIHEPPPAKPQCDCINWCGDDARIYDGRVRPCAAHQQQREHEAALASAWRLADEKAIDHIELRATRVDLLGEAWWDTAPLLNEHEASGEQRDRSRMAIAYALARNLFERHPQRAEWLRRRARA